MTAPRNASESVRQRLLNRSRKERRPFNELLQYFAMERFLYRLSQSAHAQRFVLKGALMLRVWGSPEFRPTMDIDLLGRTRNAEAAIVSQIRDILMVNVETDGLAFDPNSIQTERITEGADYDGVRIRFLGALGSTRIYMQIDFEGPKLVQAIQRTFERRGTALPSEIEVFTQPFIDAKQTQWAAFRNRLQQDHVPASFGEITALVSRFLWPIVADLSSEKPSPTAWIAPGPWT